MSANQNWVYTITMQTLNRSAPIQKLINLTQPLFFLLCHIIQFIYTRQEIYQPRTSTPQYRRARHWSTKKHSATREQATSHRETGSPGNKVLLGDAQRRLCRSNREKTSPRTCQQDMPIKFGTAPPSSSHVVTVCNKGVSSKNGTTVDTRGN